jgi:hypothetical protein
MQRILNVFRTRRIEDELREELEFHLAARTEEYIREGMSAHDARERAQREFGNRTAVAERARDANIAVWFEGVLQDIRYAGRQIRRSPGFASVSIASLALGIGATAALFSVLDAVVLQPLALPNPHDMVQFRESRRGNPQAGSPARLKTFKVRDRSRVLPVFIKKASLCVVLRSSAFVRVSNIRARDGHPCRTPDAWPHLHV